MGKAAENTLDGLREKIKTKEAELSALQTELNDLKGQARSLLLEMAGEFGVEFGGGGKRGTSPKSASAGSVATKDWLNKVLADGPKSEEQLSAAYVKAGMGQRFKLKTYLDKKVVKKTKDGIALA